MDGNIMQSSYVKILCFIYIRMNYALVEILKSKPAKEST